jgi:hypothetical protein
MPSNCSPSTLRVDPGQLIQLSDWLAHNHIEPIRYLKALLKGGAPPAVAFEDELYLIRADASLWRDKLRVDAIRANMAILAVEVTDAG